MDYRKRHNLMLGIFGLIYGIFGSLGFFCLINLYTMAVFHERHLYPNLYPFCICFGFISLICCISVLAGNIIYIDKAKRHSESDGKILIKAAVIEPLAAILFFFLGLMGFNFIYGLVSTA